MTPHCPSPWTRLGAAALAALATLLITASASAQTWTGGRTTPSLAELFAIDATGEPNWLYGQEDVAGDGLDTFQQQEKNIDIRTAYASTSPQQLYVRTYISDTASPGGNTSVYVFIDSDKNASTGGSAAATNIDAKFTNDPSPGGYEYVVGLKGNQSVVGLWQWDGSAWATVNFTPGQIVAEADTDIDPIKINEDVHGYIQGMIELGLVGLTQECNANLYVRSSNDNAAQGADLEVGQVGGCVPTDNNNNGIPDPIENPVDQCTSDDQCVGDGICQNGVCILPRPCVDNTDCTPQEQCTTDGRCVPIPTGTCTTNADCSNGLVCTSGQCGACAPGGNECDDGFVCAPTGRCIEDVGPGADFEDVQGGACSCSIPGDSKTSSLLALALIPLAFAARRISRRQTRS